MRWLDSLTYPVDVNLSKLQEARKDREAQHAAAHGVTKRNNLVTEQKQQFSKIRINLNLW